MAMAMAMGGRHLLLLWKKATSTSTSKVKFSTSVVGSMYEYDSRLRRRRRSVDDVMRADVIEKLKCNSLQKKIEVESDLADWGDPMFPAIFLERVCSKDMDILKGLLKDMRKLNRKNMNKVERRKKKEELMKHQQDTDIEDGVYGSMLHVEDQATVDIARHIVQAYNEQQNSKLEFARVIDVVEDPFPLDYHLFIEARDLNAASVPIKLQAFYTINTKEFKVNVLQPVPFMKLLHKDKDITLNLNKLSLEEREALLYENIRYCPIIAKRLGLKGRHELFCKLLSRLRLPYDDFSPQIKHDELPPSAKDSSISLIKLSLDHETLLSLAKFAVAEQSANQGSHLQFLRVVGAWHELMVDDRFIYHIMLEALENGVGRRFYAAVAPEPNGKDAQLVQWVATNCQKITLNEGGKV